MGKKSSCPKCGSAQIWVDLYDLPLKLVEAKYVKIDISNRKVKCAKCGHIYCVKEEKKWERQVDGK